MLDQSALPPLPETGSRGPDQRKGRRNTCYADGSPQPIFASMLSCFLRYHVSFASNILPSASFYVSTCLFGAFTIQEPSTTPNAQHSALDWCPSTRFEADLAASATLLRHISEPLYHCISFHFFPPFARPSEGNGSVPSIGRSWALLESDLLCTGA